MPLPVQADARVRSRHRQDTLRVRAHASAGESRRFCDNAGNTIAAGRGSLLARVPYVVHIIYVSHAGPHRTVLFYIDAKADGSVAWLHQENAKDAAQ
jgi:hypothetical protein